MFADEYSGGRHRDTAPMPSTLHRFASEVTPPEVLQVDRLCRSITQAVKDNSSAFIKAFIRPYLR